MHIVNLFLLALLNFPHHILHKWLPWMRYLVWCIYSSWFKQSRIHPTSADYKYVGRIYPKKKISINLLLIWYTRRCEIQLKKPHPIVSDFFFKLSELFGIRQNLEVFSLPHGEIYNWKNVPLEDINKNMTNHGNHN